MSRKKNLLEAFQRSESTRSSPGGAALPGAAPEPESGGTEAPLLERLAPALRGGDLAGRPALAIVVVAAVLAFALGYAVGRGAGGETRAGERDPETPEPLPPASQPRSFQERAASPSVDPQAALPATPSESLEESALFDSANTWTVVVAAYSNTSNPDLAWATYAHLAEARLPVFRPVESKNLVVVLVGAAPREADLERTKNTVRALERDGKRVYADAYVARIDTLIPRSTPKGNQ